MRQRRSPKPFYNPSLYRVLHRYGWGFMKGEGLRSTARVSSVRHSETLGSRRSQTDRVELQHRYLFNSAPCKISRRTVGRRLLYHRDSTSGSGSDTDEEETGNPLGLQTNGTETRMTTHTYRLRLVRESGPTNR